MGLNYHFRVNSNHKPPHFFLIYLPSLPFLKTQLPKLFRTINSVTDFPLCRRNGENPNSFRSSSSLIILLISFPNSSKLWYQISAVIQRRCLIFYQCCKRACLRPDVLLLRH